MTTTRKIESRKKAQPKAKKRAGSKAKLRGVRPARAARRPRPSRPARDESALDRFLRYVRIDTQSQDDVEAVPSTSKQLDLQRVLLQELRAVGAKSVQLDKHACLMAKVPANLPKSHPAFGRVPRVGLIAHVDTSPSASGANVKPQVFEYQGGDIVLPGDKSVVVRESENPELGRNLGKTIVTTDGTTLLGADNKAGIAIIMTALAELQAHPERLHGELCIAFTPDEEVGNGTKYFDRKRFGADVAYTIDGESEGELNRETFSANSAVITVFGRNIHPGKAKGIMVNAIRILADIIARTPKDMAPETTDHYQPYVHPHHMQGEEAKATLKLLLRDFRTEGLAEQEAILRRIIAEVSAQYPKARIELEVKETYRNMRYGLEKEPRATEALEEAVRRAGVIPRWEPIRGGTDGARLTELGLPTPNLFTGGLNFHGPTEWLSVAAMEKAVVSVLHLADVWVERA